MLSDFNQSCHDVSRSTSPTNHTRFSAAQMSSHVSPSFSSPSDASRHPSLLTSSPSQPRHTRTRVVHRPDRYTPQTVTALSCTYSFSVYFFCFTAVVVSSLLLFAATYIFGPRPAPPYSHTSFCMFAPATFHRISAFFLPLPSLAASRKSLLLFYLSFDFCLSTLHFVPPRNTWPTALHTFLSAFQPQSLFHRAFSQSTALHGTSNELFQ